MRIVTKLMECDPVSRIELPKATFISVVALTSMAVSVWSI